MRSRSSIRLHLIGLAVMALTAQPGVETAGPRQSETVRMQESSIRRIATRKPMPVYPAESIARKSAGVAVAAIRSGIDGRVADVSLLEAPDEAIAASVRTALLAWEIPATTVAGRTEPYGVRGKVTFYFQIAGGRGRVANPEEMPGGPKPEPPGGPPAMMPGARGTPPGAAPVVTHEAGSDLLEIGEEELRRVMANDRPTLLDIRERDEFARAHRDGAINIPRDELSIRAYIEIDRARPVVIDCSRTDTSMCRQAANQLRRGPKIARVLIFLP